MIKIVISVAMFVSPAFGDALLIVTVARNRCDTIQSAAARQSDLVVGSTGNASWAYIICSNHHRIISVTAGPGHHANTAQHCAGRIALFLTFS